MDWQPSTPLTSEELNCIPVFPLPRVVFFPGTALPLHLFEPRYRAMAQDCIEKGPMAMAVTLLSPGWEEDYDGAPAFHEIAGAGRIVAHKQREDGTYDIVLHGLKRVRLQELPNDGLPYRRAQAVPVDDAGEAGAGDVVAMMACATNVAARVRARQPDFRLHLSGELPPGRTADVVADQLIVNPADRQRVLQTLDVRKRISLVTEAIAGLLVQLSELDTPS